MEHPSQGIPSLTFSGLCNLAFVSCTSHSIIGAERPKEWDRSEECAIQQASQASDSIGVDLWSIYWTKSNNLAEGHERLNPRIGSTESVADESLSLDIN